MKLQHRLLGTTAIALTLATGIAMHTKHVQAQSQAAQGKTFDISVTNLTSGQTFSPSIYITHNSSAPPLWQLNAPAPFGLQRIAEEGNVGPLSSAKVVPKLGKEFGSAVTRISILPGQTRSVRVTATEQHPLLSSAWMLVMTNDGFSGLSGMNLMQMNEAKTMNVMAYDAGTERNNERSAYLIAREGTGRAPEGGVVKQHQGIRGDADAPAAWKFDPNAPVARVTITPVGN